MPTDPAVTGRRLLLAGAVAVAAAVIAVGWGVYARARDTRDATSWSEARSIPTVRVTTPEPAQGGQALELPGALQAYNEAPIYARVPGYLKDWKVDIGAHVKAGQLLAEIDAPELDQQLAGAQADLAAAKADLKLAKITADRFGDLASDDAVSKQDADEKNGALAARTAAVQAAEANVSRLMALEGFKRIVAPFDGVVTQRNANIGALVNAGAGSAPTAALFSVADVHLLRVYVDVPQSSSAAIHPGLVASLEAPQYPGRRFDAAVVSDAGSVDGRTGALLVELQVDNAGEALKPGDYVQARFSVGGGGAVMTVPASALLFRRQGLQIATVGPDGKARLQPVSIARDLGAVVELNGGLDPAARVIDTPPDSIEDGDPVRVAPRTAKAGAAHAQG